MALISKAEDRATDARKAITNARRETLEDLALKMKRSGCSDSDIDYAVGYKVYWAVSMKTGLITSAHIIL